MKLFTSTPPSSLSCLYQMILILVTTNMVLGQGPPVPGKRGRSSVIEEELPAPCYKILLDPIKGDLIVGCKNLIYRLDSTSLQESEKLSNGPVQDNENCPPPPAKCRHSALEQKDQENRILLINEDTKPYPTIITCGTAKQGMCFLIKYTNFASAGFFGSPEHYVNFIGSRKHALAFFVRKDNQSVLIVGHEPDRRPKEFSQPLISARRMDISPAPRMNYLFSSDDKKINTFVDLHADIKDRYLINLVYGFQYGEFVYFVSTQQASFSTAMYETRLSRVCLDDKSFRSYTEIQINCGTEEPPDLFNYATAAHLGVIGQQDRQLLNVDDPDQVLYVSFMQTNTRTNNPEKQPGSVICAFPMKQVADQFDTVVSDCFEGKDSSHLLEAIVGRGDRAMCTKHGPFRPNFKCGGSTYNPYIGGYEPVEARPLIRIRNEKVTALVTYVDKEQTVAFIGTSDGKILKSLLNQTVPLYMETFNNGQKDAEIRAEPVVDKKSEFLYAASGRKIIKFPMKSCSIYSSCRSCIASRDPQECGWCGDKCCSREEQPDISEQDRKACSPVIDYFTPSKGPIQGGTQITIHGDNFGNSQNGARHDITVAGVACLVEYWQSHKITCRTSASPSVTEGRISVEITDTSRATGPFEIRGRAESQEMFSFMEPKITEISPKFGPVDGGTPVVIRGVNLDMGSARQILLLSNGRNISCKENTTSADTLTCITGPYKFTAEDEKKPIVKKPFHVQFDNWKLTTSFLFELKSGPVIDRVRPRGAIRSGNTKIHVYGQNLKSMEASNPRMNFTLDKFSKSVPCTIENNTYMWCMTPVVPVEIGQYQFRSATMRLGMNVTDLPVEGNDYEIRIFPDPDVLKFANGFQKVYIEDPVMELFGSSLSIDYDWDIRIGAKQYPCVPFERDSSWTKIKCKISFPAEFQPQVDDQFPVSFRLGQFSGDLGNIVFEHKPADTSSILVACLTAIVFVLFIGFIVLLIWMKRRKTEKPGIQTPSVRYTNDRLDRADNDYIDGITDRSSDVPLIIPRSPTAIDPAVIAALNDCNKLLAKEWLTLGDIVGKGHFGCVFRARLYKPDTDETIDVAVKTMQSTNVSRREIDQFIQEAMIMKDFDHPHVLTLIGLCFPDDGFPLVVIPFMANGDLRNYVSDELNMPRVRELIGFGVDVAKGMEYLAAQKFIHRDLAARNCILDDKLNVKVADFGLSRDVYEQEYYRAESGGGLPIKWMAPECLESKKCTTKSDVWSFGVVMWEILTRGRPPYPDVGNWDMLAYLKEGRRLLQPDSCPEFLYGIMCRCWAEDPDQRPSFTQLVQEIEFNTSHLEARSAARKVGIHVTYVNVPRGNYYNPDISDDRPGVGTRISDGSSLAGESGFASSSSHRSTIPRKPAVVPVHDDDDDGRERARL